MKTQAGLAFPSALHVVLFLAWENSKAVQAFPGDVQASQPTDDSQWPVMMPREGSETVSHSERKVRDSPVLFYNTPHPQGKEEILDEGRRREVLSSFPPLNEGHKQRTINHGHPDEEDNHGMDQHAPRTQRAEDKEPKRRVATGMVYTDGTNPKRSSSPFRAQQSHQLRGSLNHTQTFFSLKLFRKQANNTARPRRSKFVRVTTGLVRAAATVVLFLLVGPTLSRSRQTSPRHVLSGLLGNDEDVNVSEDRDSNGEEEKGDGEVKPSLVSGSERKQTSPLSSPSRVLLLVILSIVILLVASATSAAPVTRKKEGKEEHLKHPGERGDETSDGSFTRKEVLIDLLPRTALARLRRTAGVPHTTNEPQVDFQRRSDGSLHVVVGRACKRSDGRSGWVDADSFIQFRYLGNTFHVYIPRKTEERLKNAGLLEEFVQALSRSPRGVVLYPDGEVKKDFYGTYHGELHWGPEKYDEAVFYSRVENGIKYSLHLPYSIYSIFADPSGEADRLYQIFRLVRAVFVEMREEGQNFSPRGVLTIVEEPKSEL